MFCHRMDVEKPQSVPLLVFWHRETFFLKKILSKGSPFQFLWYFTTHWVFKNPKGSPFSVFRHCETFFSKFVFSRKRPSFNCDQNVDNFVSFPLLARQGFFALAAPACNSWAGPGLLVHRVILLELVIPIYYRFFLYPVYS